MESSLIIVYIHSIALGYLIIFTYTHVSFFNINELYCEAWSLSTFEQLRYNLDVIRLG